jgi:hypothetical protein
MSRQIMHPAELLVEIQLHYCLLGLRELSGDETHNARLLAIVTAFNRL